MSFNGPPKPPQEMHRPKVETPEYWKGNLPFKSPQKFYELEFKLAKLMAKRTGMPLLDAVDTYASVVRNHIHTFNEEGDWEITGLEEGVTDENILEHSWKRSLERHTERNSTPTQYHEEGSFRFGCHYYDVNEDAPDTINIHFFNAEFEEEWVDGKDISKGPLDKNKIDRRTHELTDMFRDIRARYPNAKYVQGRSSLYNLEAYRRLYPDTYKVGEIDYDPKLWSQGTTVWGQFLGGNDKEKGEYGFKAELAEEFLEKAKTVPVERLADALPMPPHFVHGKIQDFYDLYGIK